MNERIGFALCGSFCTFQRAMTQMELLRQQGYDLTPIFSFAAAETDTRFGTAASFLARAEKICGKPPITTMTQAEQIGPKRLFDLLLVAPCTASTCCRLANALYDTPVTLGVKAHLRNSRPVLLAIATNDALSFSAACIGALLPRKHHFFVPLIQDDVIRKPASAVADFSLIPSAVAAALQGKQLRPLYLAVPAKAED